MIKKQRYISLSRLFPNMITIGALCLGLSAVRFAMLDRWEIAGTLLIGACILDGLDGTAARFFNASSDFGAQLDSLSDIVSFGIAPALMIHMWVLHQVKGFGWAAALIYAVCIALRLARFNTMQQENAKEETEDKIIGHHFLGVPAPAAALLVMFPLGLSFETTNFFATQPWICIIYTLLIAGLSISKIPTFSFKRIRITQSMALPAIIFATIAMILLIIEPLNMVMISGVLYLSYLPYSYLKQRKKNHIED